MATGPTHPSLWQKLQDFCFDHPNIPLPFSARLARDQGWRIEKAREVIEEYRRFLYLSQVAEHPVTPSEAVDQAWHEHLVYTHSYWDDLCGKVLGRPLHHGPTKGGSAENAKFYDWYARTLESYAREFGHVPPTAIWPSPAERFSGRFRWVNQATHFIIPRPRWSQAPLFFAICGVLTLLTSCELKGSNARIVPNVIAALAMVLLTYYTWLRCQHALLRSRLRETTALSESEADDTSPISDPYSIAYLAGGSKRFAHMLILSIAQQGCLSPQIDSLRRKCFQLILSKTDLDHSLEAAYLATLKKQKSSCSLNQMIQSASALALPIHNEQVLKGLRPNGAALAISWVYWLPLTVGGLLMTSDAFRPRLITESPIDLLRIIAALCAVFGMVQLAFSVQSRHLTDYGMLTLNRLRARFHPHVDASLGHDFDLRKQVAFWGPTSLLGVSGITPVVINLVKEMRKLEQSSERSADTSSGGGCGTSAGCGGGSGCGSSGCGGGGCGGD